APRPAPLVLASLTLHDALPIYLGFAHWRAHAMVDRVAAEQRGCIEVSAGAGVVQVVEHGGAQVFLGLRVRVAVVHIAGQLAQSRDRKSRRLNSSHQISSYAVLC